MPTKLRDSLRLLGSTLGEEQLKAVARLGWISVVLLLGVSLTGIWQLFTHAPDPTWYDYSPDSGLFPGASPSTGIAALHGFFADASVAVALFGGGWFAFRVVHRVPRLAVLAFLLGVASIVTGSLIRFNIVKLTGRPFGAAGDGYVQIFSSDVDYVVTDKNQLGPLAIRLMTVAHVVSVPILLVAAWFSITRIHRLDEFTSSRPRQPELGPPS